MFQHIVVVKFKEGTPQTERAGIVAALQALPSKIAEIRRYEVGLDILHSARSYDFALVGGFDDQAAFERYRAHPEHVRLAQQLKDISQNLIAVDLDA